MSKVRALGGRWSRGLLGPTADGAVGTCGSGSKDRRLALKPPLLLAKVVQVPAVSSWWGDLCLQLMFYFWCQNCVWEGVWKANGDVKKKEAPGSASGFGFEFC